MSNRFADRFARQLRLPTRGLMGWITLQFLKIRNKIPERNAARLCDIKPHHNVLEVGFGPGIGIQEAVKYVKDGPGKIYGIDLSTYMLETASSRLRKPIRDGKVELVYGNVEFMPYSTDFFDRVLHCNCYYFWPSMQHSLSEIMRVMKPGGIMVTTICMKSIQKTVSRGLLKYGNPDPVKYMCALELMGFMNVKMEYYKEGSKEYQAIFAHLPKVQQPDLRELEEAQQAAEERQKT